MKEQEKSMELLAMERLLRNESKTELDTFDDNNAGFGASILKKEVKKTANEKTFNVEFYTSSTADERGSTKERD